VHPLIEKNRVAIENLCRMHEVRRLEFFGSILRDDFNDDRSDVDALLNLVRRPRTASPIFWL
jgi:predicted nucleotidyltransferase